MGNGSDDIYTVDFITPWTPFGTSLFETWDTTSGSSVSLYSNPVIGLPDGYTSGDSLAGSATTFGATFASLGFTPGSYVTVVTNAVTDTVTVNIGAVAIAVPEPGTLGLLIGLAWRIRRA